MLSLSFSDTHTHTCALAVSLSVPFIQTITDPVLDIKYSVDVQLLFNKIICQNYSHINK